MKTPTQKLARSSHQHGSNAVRNKSSIQLLDQRPETHRLRQLMHIADTHQQPISAHRMPASNAHDKYVSQFAPQEESTTAVRHGGVTQRHRGLPAQLKAGIEALSGMNMEHVNVYYNSSQPAQLNAHAYAQGSEIHLAPGQEQHLPHEAWHVVQQAQGRVRPTLQMKPGVAINDDQSLEQEADVMGARAMQLMTAPPTTVPTLATSHAVSAPLQRRTLAQAGLDHGMAAVADQALIGGNVGPALGMSYTENLGVQATKTAALSAAGASYAGLSAVVPIADLLSRTQIADTLRLRQDAITAYINGIQFDPILTTIDAATHIKTNILEPVINPAIKNNIDDVDLSNILAALRGPITKNNTNHRFFAPPLAPGPLNILIRAHINHTWRGNANVIPIDPFLYRAQSTVNGENLSVSYQHSHDWPGYVTYIQVGANNASMRLNGPILDPTVVGIPDNFGRKHHETNHDNLANDLDLDIGATRLTNERRFDSITKLAGEGARFICIRDNLGVMTDKSRFYVMGHNQDDPTKYVTLEDLWSSWATVFDKRNGIPNVTVRAAINTGAAWTYGYANNQEARVYDFFNDPPMGLADVNLS